MMGEKYEGETCEGCVWRLIPHGDVQPCEDCTDMSQFKRSLECRKVLALEQIAKGFAGNVLGVEVLATAEDVHCYICGAANGLAHCVNSLCDGWVCPACVRPDGQCSTCRPVTKDDPEP